MDSDRRGVLPAAILRVGKKPSRLLLDPNGLRLAAPLGASLLAVAPPRLRRQFGKNGSRAPSGAAEMGSRSFARPSRSKGGASHLFRPSLCALLLALAAACAAEEDARSPDAGSTGDVLAPDALADLPTPADEGPSSDALPSWDFPDPSTEDIGEPPADTWQDDAGQEDPGQPPEDAAPDDAAPADAGEGDEGGPADAGGGGKSTTWGPIGGACGILAAELYDEEPSFFVSTWQFDDPAAFDPEPLSPGAKKRYEGPNAGGSSKCSEVMSIQYFVECDGATLYKTETEIVYDQAGSITDYELELGGQRVGVSVTRAYKGPTVDTYTESDAVQLLTKKLQGINESTANVSAADAWVKQVLHVWTLKPGFVPVVEAAWAGLPGALRSDTVVVVTVEEGSTYIVQDACE